MEPNTAEGELLRHTPGRNRTKADLFVRHTQEGPVALKDYAPCGFILRHTLGRFLVRRECLAYARAAGAPGLPRFLGRRGPFALALEWIEARPLAEQAEGTVPAERFERLAVIVDELHRRGIALADLSHRDVLLADDSAVFVVDLAASVTLGARPGRLRRALFARCAAADRFALARLRARYCGENRQAAIAAADPAARAWHRRARRLKYCWDRLRGAPRLPPVDDHWRF